MSARRTVLLAASLIAASCSDAANLRETADRDIPVQGPVAAARDHESAAAVGDVPAKARQRELPSPLAYDACIAWALEYNRDLRQQISAAERARLGVAVARSQVYAPRLTATVAHELDRPDQAPHVRTDTDTNRIELDSNALGFTVAPYAQTTWSQTDGTGVNPYTSEVGVSLSRRLLALYERTRQAQPLTIADRGYAQSVNSLLLRTRQLAADAARVFLAVQQAETRMHLRERRLADSKAFLASMRESVATGLKAPLEETNALIDANQAEADLLADRTAVANTHDNLLSLLDRPLGGEVVIVPRQLDDARPALPPIEEDIAAVLAGHEDLRNLRIDLDQALDDARIQSDNTRPDLTGTLSALRRWTGPAPGDTVEREDILAVTVTLAMPLDAWSGDRALLGQLQRKVRESKQRLRSRQIELEKSVRELRRRIDQLVTGVDLARQRQAAELDKFKATQASYDAGRLDNLELTRAHQSLDQAEVDLLQSRTDLALALSDRRVLLPLIKEAPP